MPKTTRRVFIQTAALGAAALSLRAQSRNDRQPKVRALEVPGVHAYPMEHSIAAGEMLELCVSSTVPYSLQICRLGLEVDNPAADEVCADLGEQPANPQPIRPGSYIHVAKPLEGKWKAITLECWVRAWDVTKLQGLISQEDKDVSDGFALGIGKDGYVGFYLGDGSSPDDALIQRTKTGVVPLKKWIHVAATWDGKTKRIFVNGEEVCSTSFSGPLVAGTNPLRLGAMGAGGATQHFLEGDLAMPSVYDRALSQGEIREHFESKALQEPRNKGLIACWPLEEEKGGRVRDIAGKRHGAIVNHATWMIGGPSFKAAVARFGDYDPQNDSQRGHGIRFASDDIYDCGWNVTHRWKTPANTRPGIYVARMKFNYEGKERTYHCTFIVRRGARRPKAPILLVCATNTWRAYSGTPFALTPPNQKQVWGTGGYGPDTGLPSYCLYRGHAAGQGTYQMGLRVPWPAAGPYVLYGGATSYSHLMRADRFPQAWLEREGYRYDIISDVDLHRNPGMLAGYKVFVVVGHNEYWSLPMYRGLEKYLKGGGNLVVLSGNTMGWRVSFNDDCTVMECRKVDAPGDQVPKSLRGECWHSQDGLRGGPQRECGMPGYRLIALDIIGWNNPSNPKNFGPYVVEDADHFFFNTPEKTGFKKGDTFGPMANGHETDIRPSTFAAIQVEPSPDGGVIPPDPAGIKRIANGILPWKEGGQAMDYFFRVIKPKTDQGGEMIYWERPDGGRVFNAGAIGSGWALHADEKWAAVVRNVLHHFGVPKSA